MTMPALRISRSAPWIPASLAGRPGIIRHRFAFTDAERRIYRKRRHMPVSRWSELYRIVTLSSRPGRWKNATTPYLSGIMDASMSPSVRQVILCKTPQIGGTEAILNCLGYLIDRDPGPVLCVYPDELTARENCQDRIMPMIRKTGQLRGYMTGMDDDAAALRIHLQHMPIYMAWARSAARLANKPIRYAICDEVDKYPDSSGKREASPMALVQARLITYRHNSKLWMISTPTVEAGIIWQALTKDAQAIYDYHATCPFCGHHHRMEFKNIRWPHHKEPGPDGKRHSVDPSVIEAEHLARYECPKCAIPWTDYDRDAAVRSGKWRDRETGADIRAHLEAVRPARIGFHLPSLVSPFVSLSQIAAAFLRSRTDAGAFKDFCNKHLAEPWRMTVTAAETGDIMAARCDLPPQTVPERAIALTVGVDVQLSGFWYAVRAWAPDMTSWLIHYGYLATWADVERLIYDSSYPVDGTPRSMRIFRALVDTGGGRKYENMTMTEETYFWLITNRGRGGASVWGAKGASAAMPGMLTVGNAILSTPAGKKLPDALRIISVDTGKMKDQYHYRLKLASQADTRDLPGAAFLHAGVDDGYAAQIQAEEKRQDEGGRESWVNVHSRPNHLLDAEVLAMACAEMEFPGGGLRLLAGRPSQVADSTASARTSPKDGKIKTGRW